MSITSTVITVFQLTTNIKNQLETNFSYVSVQGEISNCTIHSSGHAYFDLKDAQAKIPVVIFRAKQTITRTPKDGDQVIINGSLSVYPPHGKYQIIANSISYQGVGELLVRFEKLKQKLSLKGWFDRDKKKKLPPFPKKIGVVTSPTGAVIQDIIHILSRRCKGFHLILYPVPVQGESAANEISKAIDNINLHSLCDVIIVGRGGGSLEDLWPFNEEKVAESIFNSKIPIISAVGHETDFTISDFVADVRAPTPSAAAEIVTTQTQQLLSFLQTSQKQISHSLLHQIKNKHYQLSSYLKNSLLSSPYSLTSNKMQRLDEIKSRCDSWIKQEITKKQYLLSGLEKQKNALKPVNQVTYSRLRLNQYKKGLDFSISNHIQDKTKKLQDIIQQLQALDPKNVLKRGYSLLFALNNNSVILSTKNLTKEQHIKAILSDGKAILKVEEVL